MEHFICDYETMGQNPLNCALVNCSYYIFDTTRFQSDNPYTHKELLTLIQFDKFNVPQQKKEGFAVEKDTVDWWMKQEPDVRAQCLPSDIDITREQHARNIKKYVSGRKISRWWSRGNSFEPVILKSLDDEHGTGIFNILRFWNMRDTRTFVDAKFNFTTRSDFPPFEDVKKWDVVFKKHNSLHDVSADILRMQQIYRAEAGLELINE